MRPLRERTRRNALSTFATSTGAAATLLLAASAAGAVMTGSTEPLTRPGAAKPAAAVTLEGGRVLFVARDRQHGFELWRTGGKGAGAVLVKDIWPGPEPQDGWRGPGGTDDASFTVMNGKLFFGAYDGEHAGLWQSDGTGPGTVLVKEFPRWYWMGSSVVANGRLFFVVWTYLGEEGGGNLSELWTSDGTEAGTLMVKDGFTYSRPYLFEMNGTVFFYANGALWRSDGTTAGTITVPTRVHVNPREMVNVNGTLYFAGCDSRHGCELWKSDGTEAGTVLVKDIWRCCTEYGNPSSYPHFLRNVKGTLLFYAEDSLHGSELWRSDGTSWETVLVKDIHPGPSWSEGDWDEYEEGEPASARGLLFFQARDGVHGYELWRSDGTRQGTVLLKNIAPGGGYWGSSWPEPFESVQGFVFFGAYDGETLGLWRSDGTEADTVLVTRLGGGPGHLTNVHGTLFFTGSDGRHGIELWRSGGTSQTTEMVADIFTGPEGSEPRDFTYLPAAPR